MTDNRPGQSFLCALAILLAACGSGPTSTATPVPAPGAAPAATPSLWLIPPELNGTSWTLVELNGQPLLAGTSITLTLQTGHTSGFAGCNWYRESFTYDPTPLPPGSFEITVMGCLTPVGVLDQETAYMQALRQVARRAQTAGRLEFFDAAGKRTLVFMAQAP